MLSGKKVLLIITGGIAAYKCPDLVRGLLRCGANVRCVLTEAAKQFVTPMALSAISGDRVFDNLFSLTDENEMGHIQLSRDMDVVLVAPATAGTLAKIVYGGADDLASTLLLATDKPILVAPAMNVKMWENAATRANIDILKKRGILMIGPGEGEMACGEYGLGRMAEPSEIIDAVEVFFNTNKVLFGRHALVTSGPTYEAIDPVRYIANRSSGKQGHAVAEALAEIGCRTTLVTGPTQLKGPSGVKVVHVESAVEMLAACNAALPADVAVCAAAVCDWRILDKVTEKLKKPFGDKEPTLRLTENPDVLANLARAGAKRPKLLIGFAAETENVIENATEKLIRKECDWIIANDVSPEKETFSNDYNTVHLIRRSGREDWPVLRKKEIGKRLAQLIANSICDEAQSADAAQ